VHKILTNTCYASWQWPYGQHNSRDGGRHAPSSVIYVPVPAAPARSCAHAGGQPAVGLPRLIDDATVDLLKGLGGLAAIAEQKHISARRDFKTRMKPTGRGGRWPPAADRQAQRLLASLSSLSSS